ncbi:DedA family protein [Microlunatus soli]|uniref:Membrane protein DedA, SNARE-associated domain n=1 Tax=Microlunatus soli TaxID=630515 RepID=A0A1H1MW76_9ACTN|nr:DedA family protein [Microlunatus soli]SDR91006.1 membrane protein DedA, SNARE-associated domain [Microlunatus soli]
MIDNLLTTITDWAIGMMEALGAPGAGLAIALENVFPPLPSEVILPLAGFTAAQGRLVLWQVLIWTTVGSVVGALVLYGIGAALGRDRLRRLVDRLPLIKLDDVDLAERWFTRHGPKAVLIGRLVPIVRSLISIPAGLERMSLPRFVALTALGSGVWNTLLVSAGYLLGSRWHLVEDGVGIFSKIVVVAVLAAIVVWVIRAVRRRQRTRADRSEQPEAHRSAAAERSLDRPN